jgi:phenylalanyl-tRNA synthetase beta chain
MRVPLGWLAEWVDLPDSSEALVERLTLAGLEIDSVARSGPELGAFVVGRVAACERHPNADRLSVCRVDVGGEELDIVCGAPNVAAGQKVAVARVGTTLPDGTRIQKAKLRGVSSSGMICSARELGLGGEHEGILVLPEAAAPGVPLDQVLPGAEPVLEIEITPNRGDWASLLGVAREVRANFGGALRLPPGQPREDARRTDADVDIQIEDRAGCHRYVGRVVRGVRVGASPEWLRRRLESAGLRSINNVVDVTNLVLLELGQPLHAFDLAALRGGRVRVRSARPGEVLRTLDGAERRLEAGDLVIADAERAIALAGVMGGAETEVRDGTTDLLIESAHFHPSRVRRTARRLGLKTEASYRFERGVDRDGIARAADRAALLLAEVAGGAVSAGAVVALGDPPAVVESVRLEPARVNRLLGTALSDAEIEALLRRADLEPRREADGSLTCRVPSWRNDVERPEDLIEEIARLYGYERIPTALPRGELCPVTLPRTRLLAERARDSLVASGLDETMTFPSVRRQDLDRLGLALDDPRRRVVRLENPLVDDEAQLWPLVVPSLLRVIAHNRARQVDEVRVFAVAHVFRARDAGELPDEPLLATAAIARGPLAELWPARRTVPLFFELKGIAERLLEDLGVEAHLAPGAAEPWLHPGAANEIRVGALRVGSLGDLHPEVAERYEIRDPCGVLEVDLSALARAPGRTPRYREVSRQPRLRRDLAVVLEREQPAADVLEAIRKTAGGLLVASELFDRYEGPGVPEGRVSLAFRLDFQRADRTLEDAEVNRVMDRLVQMLAQRFGGERRQAAPAGGEA